MGDPTPEPSKALADRTGWTPGISHCSWLSKPVLTLTVAFSFVTFLLLYQFYLFTMGRASILGTLGTLGLWSIIGIPYLFIIHDFPMLRNFMRLMVCKDFDQPHVEMFEGIVSILSGNNIPHEVQSTKMMMKNDSIFFHTGAYERCIRFHEGNLSVVLISDIIWPNKSYTRLLLVGPISVNNTLHANRIIDLLNAGPLNVKKMPALHVWSTDGAT